MIFFKGNCTWRVRRPQKVKMRLQRSARNNFVHFQRNDFYHNGFEKTFAYAA